MKTTSLKPRLKRRLSPKRYNHSLRVAVWAAEIAGLCGANPDDAYLAGLLHDCERENTEAELLAKARNNHLRLTKKYKAAPALLHCLLGARAAQNEFGIQNKDVLNAIKNHAAGRARMSRLEKIIYVADYTEPGRTYPKAAEIRRQLRRDKNIDRAVLSKARSVLKYLKNKRLKSCSPARKRKSCSPSRSFL
ncbi:MAG: bis(5'-nucleosyl)-tetraphosphatase (symmetrical) YqeK [Candidatus Margulisbacteria bacterium]|jgi:predicted HD superfamily hydrolase involved in NAD metabolism|nr:bis(5'-nucleosyl)-tetraphosphatase (symmetrical) YqeK [Candidatus Margulisiibacteriota bacterium]